jgi:pSer/pThr/pTyr-binding forkhead associated (FHA) protein
MKVYSIGRDPGCNIVLHDDTDVISRQHAILNISSAGKIRITDLSSNGTYINGIRITSNVPVPVTRKDIISFAHVRKLDWNTVPSSNTLIVYTAASFAGLLLIVGAFFVFRNIDFGNNDAPININPIEKNVVVQPPAPVDSTKIEGNQTDSIPASKQKDEDEKKPETEENKDKKKKIIKKEKEKEKKDEKEPVNRPLG